MDIYSNSDLGVNWDNFFRSAIVQSGHGVFEGYPYQRGFGNRNLRGHGLGNIFRSLFRIFSPIAKRVGKAVGRQALRTGAEIATDVVSGENLKHSFKKRGKAGVQNLINKASSKLSGQGLGTRRRRGLATKRKGEHITLGVLKRKKGQKLTQLFDTL